MERTMTLWSTVWTAYFQKAKSFSQVEKVALSALFAVLTAVSAHIRIPLAFTPVPVTAQVFVVLLSGILLGKNYGALSQFFYIAGSAAGIAWFTTTGGLTGLTFGYLVGFMGASYVVGRLSERKESGIGLQIPAMLAGICIILTCGTIWLSLFLRVGMGKAFMLGFLPFIAVDILKAYCAGFIANGIIRHRS